MKHKIELTIDELEVAYVSLRMFEAKCSKEKEKGLNYSQLAVYEIVANHIALMIKDILDNEEYRGYIKA